MRRTLIAVCVAVLFFACAASAGTDPKSLVREVTNANFRGQYGKIWPSLHPRYRAVTTRAFWESCQRKRADARAGVEVLSVKVSETYPDRITLPLLGRVAVTAVSVELRVNYLGEPSTVRDTLYVMKVSGTWFGLWDPETYRAYRAKRCPPT